MVFWATKILYSTLQCQHLMSRAPSRPNILPGHGFECYGLWLKKKKCPLPCHPSTSLEKNVGANAYNITLRDYVLPWLKDKCVHTQPRRCWSSVILTLLISSQQISGHIQPEAAKQHYGSFLEQATNKTSYHNINTLKVAIKEKWPRCPRTLWMTYSFLYY